MGHTFSVVLRNTLKQFSINFVYMVKKNQVFGHVLLHILLHRACSFSSQQKFFVAQNNNNSPRSWYYLLSPVSLWKLHLNLWSCVMRVGGASRNHIHKARCCRLYWQHTHIWTLLTALFPGFSLSVSFLVGKIYKKNTSDNTSYLAF